MEKDTLKKGLQALQWEAYYLKKSMEDSGVSGYFLAPQTSLDPDFEQHLHLLENLNARILDVGSGLGEQSIFLTKLGYDVIGIDISASAVAAAQQNAQQENVSVHFMVDNILQPRLAGMFDMVVDRGCYTLIPDIYKSDYVAAVKRLMKQGGWLIVKVDKKNSEWLSLFREDRELKLLSVTVSAYKSLKGRKTLAHVAVIQKSIG